MNQIFKISLSVLLLVLATAFSSASVQDTVTGTYELQPGALVEVRGINGKVEIESWGSSVAELRIERSARTDADLESRPVRIEHGADRLIIHVENRDGHKGEVRDNLYLSIPVATGHLGIKGVNGKVVAGYVDGNASVSGINGPVEVAQGGGEFSASGINGSVKVEMGVPEGEGISLSGINGAISIALAGQPNADLDITAHHGRVDVDFADADIDEPRYGRIRGRIGSGGTPIKISGVNGRIRITP